MWLRPRHRTGLFYGAWWAEGPDGFSWVFQVDIFSHNLHIRRSRLQPSVKQQLHWPVTPAGFFLPVLKLFVYKLSNSRDIKRGALFGASGSGFTAELFGLF